MIETQLDEAALSNEPVRTRIIADLAARPEETLGPVLNTLRQRPNARWEVALHVIRKMGYPRNAPALPTLVALVTDRNAFGWQAVIETLTEMGPEVVVPHLIRVLWQREQNPYWGDDVESICTMLSQVEQAYAIQCGPMIAHLLGRDDLPPPHELGKDFLLDVLEKARPHCVEYALPSLLHLLQKEGPNEIGKQAYRLIMSFDKDALEPYQLVLPSLSDDSSAERKQ